MADRPSIRFCDECNNILLPRITNSDTIPKLQYECRVCVSSQEPQSTLIVRKFYKEEKESGYRFSRDMIHDPSLPSVPQKCHQCDAEDAVSVQARRLGRKDLGLAVCFICKSCLNCWLDPEFKFDAGDSTEQDGMKDEY
eukprot:TRINITY_DN700_c0_g1_i2.p1 TRINITY_DN700_c0_g1~~TRINITY_DN700_c0_g1_i2.p1  ORF type:complete len:139 (-),score=29.02 TRINITY_DN700_c0_g1_i2:224-640(-)